MKRFPAYILLGAAIFLGIVWMPQAKAADLVNLPRDGGGHLDKLAEWWYFNGLLTDKSGSDYGYELVFFRVGPFYRFAHFAVTDVGLD